MGNAILSNRDQKSEHSSVSRWADVGFVIAAGYLSCELVRYFTDDGTAANQVAASLQSDFQMAFFTFVCLIFVFTHFRWRRA
jgi:hypothetical protein